MPSTRRISHIDQKIAAEFHLRQIETIIFLERLAAKIDVMFFTAGERLAQAAAIGKANSRLAGTLFQTAFSSVQRLLFDELEDHCMKSHESAAEAFINSIPLRYFKSVSPEVAASGIESVDFSSAAIQPGGVHTTEDTKKREKDPPFQRFRAGNVNVDSFTEPVAKRKRRLSKEKWNEFVKKVVFPPPSLAEVQAIINVPDSNGNDWQDRILILSNKVDNAERLGSELSFGYSQGENLQQLKQRVLPLVQNIQSSAKRIVRTEGLRIAETTQRREWESLGDMMVGVQILAVMDERTRPEHAARNGTIYYNEPTGNQKGIGELPSLPDAPNCRCWSTPVLRPPKELENDPLVAASFSNASGAGIPDPTTYDQWFASADTTRRKLAVGTSRYGAIAEKLGDTRQPEWTDFIDDDGKLLAISRLKSETITQRTARKERVSGLIAERRARLQDVLGRGF